MRYALIKDGLVVNVILATEGFWLRADPMWLATFDKHVQVPNEAFVEPRAVYDEATKTFTRGADVEAEIAERTRAAVELEAAPEKVALLEQRVVELEARVVVAELTATELRAAQPK